MKEIHFLVILFYSKQNEKSIQFIPSKINHLFLIKEIKINQALKDQ